MQKYFEKIKEGLNRIKENGVACEGCPYDCTEGGCEIRTLDATTEVVNQVAEEYKTECNSSRLDDGWIPCSSGEMPKDCEYVFVWFEYFRYGNYNRLYQTHGISFTHNGEWSGFVNGQSGWHQLRIIAWQPLPAPYQPKGE